MKKARSYTVPSVLQHAADGLILVRIVFKEPLLLIFVVVINGKNLLQHDDDNFDVYVKVGSIRNFLRLTVFSVTN